MHELHVGRGTTRGAMTVFPLWAPTTHWRRYAMGAKDLDVSEVDGGPDVSTLMVGNVGDRPVLVLEGQLFEGGWQHRMSVGSTMIGVHQRIPVPVACVEQGRWGGTTTRQSSRGRRATPYVRDSVRHGGDVQGEVWRRVASHVRCADNPTGSFVHRLDRADRERETWSALRPLPGQSGVLIGIGGQPYVAEVFDSPMRLRAQLPALLEAAALDALLAPAVETPSRRARRFVERLDHVRLGDPEPAGVGERLRAVTAYADVASLRWQGYPVHTRATHTRHPMLVAA